MKTTSLKISVFVVITLSVFAMLAGFLIYKNLINTLGIWNKSNKMTVFLKIDTTTDEKESILAKIKQFPAVISAVEVDRQKAGLEFQKSLKEYSSGLVTTDELIDLIPETLEVDIDKALDLEQRTAAFSRLAGDLRSVPAVDDVSFSATWLKKFEGLDKFIRSSGIFIFLLLLLLISYLVALMVRTYIDDAKQEIEIYNLLGATRWSLYKLFLKDIFVFLAGSLATSFAALLIIFDYFKSHLGEAGLARVLVENLSFLSVRELVILGLSLFVFIYFTSFLTISASVNRLNQISND